MVAAQLDVSVGQALIRLRAYAFANNLPLAHVATDVVARKLRFDDRNGRRPSAKVRSAFTCLGAIQRTTVVLDSGCGSGPDGARPNRARWPLELPCPEKHYSTERLLS